MYVSRYIFDPNAGNGPVTPLPMRAGRAYLISTNAVARISGPNPEAKPFEGYIEKPSGRAYGVATLLTQPACLRGHDLASNPNKSFNRSGWLSKETC